MRRVIIWSLVALMVVAIAVVSWQVRQWWQGRGDVVLQEMEVIRHAPNLVEVIPEIRTKLETEKLKNQELYGMLSDAHQELEWYAEYTAELEERVAEGEAKVVVDESGYTVSWSEEWSDGQTWTDPAGGGATYRIDYHIPPIDLQVYKTDEGVWLGTTSSGVVIGEVEVVEKAERESFWDKFGAEVNGGVGSRDGDYTWLVGGEISYSGIGIGGQIGNDWQAVLISYEF